MKKANYATLILLVGVSSLISCTKNNNVLNESGIKPSNSFKIAGGFDENIINEYDNFWVREALTRGDFNVQTSSRMFYDIQSENGNVNTFFSGVCYGGELVAGPTLNTINNGSFFINDEEITFVNDEAKRYDYKKLEHNIFGRNNIIKLEGIQYEGFEDHIYLPKEILITNPRPTNDSSELAYLNYSDDIQIEWNADNQNNKGVVIQITPLSGSVNSGATNNMGTNILAQDNGTYILTSLELEAQGLHVGDSFSIRIYRGNFKLIQSTTKKELYSFFAHTYSEVNIKLQ